MPHEYERLGVFTLNEVLPHVPEKGTQRVLRRFCGKGISLSKKKLRVFAKKGTTCACCGIEGSFMALERHKKATRWHFNVYAVDVDGEQIQITLDHIIPRSKGGTSEIENLQPMCEPCNLEKGDTLSNPSRKSRTWDSSRPKNLTKLAASWLPFVRKKQYSFASSLEKTRTCQQTKSSED